MCCGKFFLFVLNFVVLGVGVGLVTLSSMVIHRSSQYGELMMDGILTLPIWTIVVGVIISLIGFFGCCGALKQNKCMLYLYAIIVLALFAAQLALGVLVFTNKDEVEINIKEGLLDGFDKYGYDDVALTNTIDLMQSELKCCGVSNYTDWFTILYEDKVTKGCCRPDQEEPACFTNLPSSETDLEKQIYTTGCFDAFIDWTDSLTISVGAIAIILALIELFCVFVACNVARGD